MAQYSRNNNVCEVQAVVKTPIVIGGDQSGRKKSFHSPISSPLRLQLFSSTTSRSIAALAFYKNDCAISGTSTTNLKSHSQTDKPAVAIAIMSDPLLFEDTFTITAINAQKYDRVSRLTCTSNDASLTFTLDVNSELYPCAVGESLSLAIASTLSLDGKEDTRASWREVSMGDATLADDYDYVCHGKVYRFEEGATKDTM
jgi:DNA-directed RNA polymerase I, II, and III subunit RPABC3